jgi:chlorite dismutase
MEKRKRQFVNYLFYKVMPQWRHLDRTERERGKADFAEILQQYSRRMILRTYSTVGTRADTDVMLWRVCDDLETLREMTTALNSTSLAKYLTTPYSYLAMTQTLIDVDQPRHPDSEDARLEVVPGKAKYLFVYPFVKAREWYLLSKDVRQGMVDEHLAIGHKYPSVKINTCYSFGLDDQEFVVAFESDEPANFLGLVMELRESEASRYTVRDTPTFTCIAMGVWEMLDALGG